MLLLWYVFFPFISLMIHSKIIEKSNESTNFIIRYGVYTSVMLIITNLLFVLCSINVHKPNTVVLIVLLVVAIVMPLLEKKVVLLTDQGYFRKKKTIAMETLRNIMKINLLTKILFFLSIGIVAIVFLYWGVQKDIWFCDEMYTYFSTNSPGKKSIFTNAQVWLSGLDVRTFMAAKSTELNFSEIADTISTDHVPLYLYLIRVMSIIFLGISSKWIGLLVNLLILELMALLIWLVIYRCFKSPWIALFASITLPLHPLILQQATTIRMYLMLSFSMLLTVFWVTKIRKNTKRKDYVLLTVVMTIGMLTHYYYWVFLGIYMAFHILVLLFEKSFIQIKKTIISCFGALILTTLAFPNWIINIQVGNGKKSVGNLLDFSSIGDQLTFGFKEIIKLIRRSETFFLLYVILFLVILCLYIIFYGKTSEGKGVLVAEASFFMNVMFVCHSMPNVEERYLWNSVTMIYILSLYMLFCVMWEIFTRLKVKLVFRTLISIAMLSVILVSHIGKWDGGKGLAYLRYDSAISESELMKYSNLPWLIFNEHVTWRLECSYWDLTIPDRISRIDSNSKPFNDPVIADSKEIIVFVDANDENFDEVLKDDLQQAQDYISEIKGADAKQIEKIGKSIFFDIYKLTW